MDQDFTYNHQILLEVLNENNEVIVIDGRPIDSGDITHTVKVGMKIQDHGEQLPMFITKLRH